ncbi:hypothetical protein C8R44DRAFT_750581 [Mycena epipterygia]|nr:hypothetical protein C8R44DRAFT_750581 [Mycena epipterygia]
MRKNCRQSRPSVPAAASVYDAVLQTWRFPSESKSAAAQAEIDAVDPEYAPPSEEEDIVAPIADASKSRAKKPEELASRKRRHENSDLYEKTDVRSRTSKWRDENRITKKARIINAQPSIANLFKVFDFFPVMDNKLRLPAQKPTEKQSAQFSEEVSLVYLQDIRPHVPALSLGAELQAAEHVEVDSDSDVEMISAPDSSLLDVPESSPSVLPIEQPLTLGSSTAAPPPANDPAGDGGYSTGDSDDDQNTHELSLAAIELTFKKFDSKIKNAQRLVMVNGLTEFNVQRRKREIERVNLAKKIDNVPRPQRPKLRARLRKIKPSIAANITVANQFSKTKYWAGKLRSIARTFSETGELPENNQGKGAKHKTHFDDPDVKPRLEAFARGLVPEAEGGFKGRIAPDKLRRYINEFLFPELEIEDTIGVTTATAWLKKLGYRLRRYQKGIYYDGHERPDVVQKRNESRIYLHAFRMLINTKTRKRTKLARTPAISRKFRQN